MQNARKVNPQDAPILVACPYTGAIYNLQPIFKLIYRNYFFQEIEKVSDELDEVLLFINQNMSEDGDLQNLPKVQVKILLVKEFFKTLNLNEF